MKKLFLIFLILLINLNLVLSLDSSTPLICGGDAQTLVVCLGDESLTFLGLDVPEGGEGFGGTPGVEETHTEPEPTPPIILEPFLLFGIIDISFLKDYGLGPEDLWLIYGVLVIFILCLCLWLRKRKCDKCKKRFRYKDLTKYKNKYYCDKCLAKMEK